MRPDWPHEGAMPKAAPQNGGHHGHGELRKGRLVHGAIKFGTSKAMLKLEAGNTDDNLAVGGVQQLQGHLSGRQHHRGEQAERPGRGRTDSEGTERR